jgi:hypothetical protein
MLPQPSLFGVLLFLFLLACGPKPTPPALTSTPMLPAITAQVYAQVPATPTDPVVREAVAALGHYDESLSGAAAGLAMSWTQSGTIDTANTRWSAYRAGWPHPIDLVRTEILEPDGTPVTLLEGITPPEGASLGVARVRHAAKDHWVLLLSNPRIPLAAFGKEQVLGAEFTLHADPNRPPPGETVTVSLASPTGTVTEGLPRVLDTPGEWVMEIHGEESGLLLTVPLYVGEAAPEDAPLAVPRGLPSTRPEDQARATALGMDAIDEVRDLVNAPTLIMEPLLSASAREALRQWMAEEPISDPFTRAAALGFGESLLSEISCTGASINECVDDLYWSIPTRVILLDPRFRFAGCATNVTTASVQGGLVSMVVDLATP